MYGLPPLPINVAAKVARIALNQLCNALVVVGADTDAASALIDDFFPDEKISEKRFSDTTLAIATYLVSCLEIAIEAGDKRAANAAAKSAQPSKN